MDIFTFFNQYNFRKGVPKTDGGFPGQCVSLINQYCWKVLGVPAGAWGNAKDWAINAIQRKYFNLVDDQPRLGDILIWGADYGGGSGHIAIYAGNGKVFDQNGGAGTATCGFSEEYPRRIAILRPLKPFPEVWRQARVNVDVLNVRTKATQNSPIVLDAKAGVPEGQLKKGNIVIVKGQVEGEFYGAGNLWFITKSGYYIAAAYVDLI